MSSSIKKREGIRSAALSPDIQPPRPIPEDRSDPIALLASSFA
jgi:hypothetical protein